MYYRQSGSNAKWTRITHAAYLTLLPEQRVGLEIKGECPPSHKVKRQRSNAGLLRTVTGTRANLQASSRHLRFHAELTPLERDVLGRIDKLDTELRVVESQVRRLLRNEREVKVVLL
jgi:hypothetical protein